MDLITADPSTTSSTASASSGSTSSSSAAAPPPSMPPPSVGGGISSRTTLGEKKSKRAAFMQIQNDTVLAAKAVLNPVRGNILPQKQRQKKKVPALLTFRCLLLFINGQIFIINVITAGFVCTTCEEYS